ncbi:MAG: hypothetical protein ACXABG_05195 [Promethearchaeota archaeon]|jgi:hypothetical protein
MKLDKKKYVFMITFIGMLLISLNFSLASASDDDDDGIDDDFEELNKRDIVIEIEADKIQIESSLRNGASKDSIQLKITNDSEGLLIEVSYESELTSGNTTLYELEFDIIFRKLIEYVDLDDNDIYDPLIDDTILEYNLTDFQQVKYTEITVSENTKLHYFVLNTTDGVFATHIYFSEEFFVINETLITPVQSKLDIEISNFPYINTSSDIALYTSLGSEIDYEDDEVTEDEENEYAVNERGVFTKNNTFTGIFSWKNNASIDDVSKQVFASELAVDDYDGDEQMLYLMYSRGSHIYHDPKVGIAGIFRVDNPIDNPFFLIILIAIISSLSVSFTYGIYHYRKRLFTDHYSKLEKTKDFSGTPSSLKYKSPKLDEFFDNTRLLHQLKELASDKALDDHDINVTAFSKDFFQIVNMFEWEEDDLIDFIKEMSSLTPEERKSVLVEMLDKSEQQKKNRLDDTKRLYT